MTSFCPNWNRPVAQTQLANIKYIAFLLLSFLFRSAVVSWTGSLSDHDGNAKKNVTLNRNDFQIFQTCSWQFQGRCYSSSRKQKTNGLVFTFYIKLWIWSFHVVVLQRTAKKWTEICIARAESLFCYIKTFRFVTFSSPVDVVFAYTVLKKIRKEVERGITFHQLPVWNPDLAKQWLDSFATRSDLAFPKNWKMSTFLKSILMLTALKPTPEWKYPKKDLSTQERSPCILWRKKYLHISPQAVN